MALSRGIELEIGIDGGVGSANLPEIVASGANFIVAGSSVFRCKKEIVKQVQSLNRLL